MIYSAGEQQINYIELTKKLNPILKKIQKLEEKTKELLIGKNIDIIMSYGKAMPYIAGIFGYEDYYDMAKDISAICKKISSGEVLHDNFSQVCESINKMIEISDKLLEEKTMNVKTCTCCGDKVYYMPLSSYYRKQAEKHGAISHVPETLNDKEYTCPNCMSSDRDRLIVSFLKKVGLDMGNTSVKLLQIAPAKVIEHWIYANCQSVVYESTDLYMDGVTFKSDIQDMKEVADESYDYIVCSHVLEHVKDDRKAMSELKRILKKDGMCIFLVPIALDVDEIDEEWGLSEQENWRRFGQNDHCRLYNKKGLIDRLKETGLNVYSLGKEYFGEEVFRECGLIDSSVLYILTKTQYDLEKLISDKLENRFDSKKEKPLVSVVMSAYNHEKYVSRAIESVLNQTYDNIEFLVADDYSTDGTVNEILKYEDRIDQIHLFDENAGGRGEFLIQIAKGKYIAMMNSDDYWEEDKISMQVNYMENHPDCGACFTGAQCVNYAGEKIDLELFKMNNKSSEERLHDFFLSGNHLCHPSILIKNEIYKKLAEGTLMYRQIPDYYMWVRLIQEHNIHIIEKKLIYFSFDVSGGSINTSAITIDNRIREVNEEAYMWYKIIKKMDNDFFVKAFKEEILDKNVSDEKEVLCEKMFVLIRSKQIHYRLAGLFLFYDIYSDLDIRNILCNKYNFKGKDIYEIASSVCIGQYEEE